MPAWAFHEIFASIQVAEPNGPRRFPAEVVHLFTFRSADWAGRLWETLTGELLHAWTPR